MDGAFVLGKRLPACAGLEISQKTGDQRDREREAEESPAAGACMVAEVTFAEAHEDGCPLVLEHRVRTALHVVGSRSLQADSLRRLQVLTILAFDSLATPARGTG